MKCKFCGEEQRDWNYVEVYNKDKKQWWELRCNYCDEANYLEKFKKQNEKKQNQDLTQQS